MTNLIELRLHKNQLSGALPTCIGQLTNLRLLQLHDNKLQSRLPSSFKSMSALDTLLLSNNQFTGTFPASSSDWTNLKTLHASHNSFQGKLPDLNGANLVSVDLQSNQLSGALPAETLTRWNRLASLQLSSNQLTGTIPYVMTSTMKSTLSELFLSDNHFTGDPLPAMDQLTTLRLLYLDRNNFTGTMQSTFTDSLQDLTALDLSHNQFVMEDAAVFPKSLFAKQHLQALDLSNNRLGGSLPDISSENTHLHFLFLNANEMVGTIPSSINRLLFLKHLDLSNNRFTGALPDTIFSLTTLSRLYLANLPSLSEGPVPAAIEGLTKLNELSLKNSNRNAALPALSNMRSLSYLDLDNNRFMGTVPVSYGNKLDNLKWMLLNRNPGLTGTLPNFTATNYLVTVLVDNTNLSGNMDDANICTWYEARKKGDPNAAVIATCGFVSSLMEKCECCRCCPQENPSCSTPVVDSVDWTYHTRHSRSAMNLGVNFSFFVQDPDD